MAIPTEVTVARLHDGMHIIQTPDGYAIVAYQPFGKASFDLSRSITLFEAPTEALCRRAYDECISQGEHAPSDWTELDGALDEIGKQARACEALADAILQDGAMGDFKARRHLRNLAHQARLVGVGV